MAANNIYFCRGWTRLKRLSNSSVPFTSYLWETLLKQWVGRIQDLFNLLSLHQILESVSFCINPLRLAPLFPTASCLSCMQPLGPLKPDVLSLCIPGVGLQVGSLIWSSDPSLLEENLCNCHYLPVGWLSTQECGPWLSGISTPLTHLIIVLPSLSLVLKKIFLLVFRSFLSRVSL